MCPTYFEIGQTYFKIQGTYFSLPENLLRKCPENADKNRLCLKQRVLLPHKRGTAGREAVLTYCREGKNGFLYGYACVCFVCSVHKTEKC